MIVPGRAGSFSICGARTPTSVSEGARVVLPPHPTKGKLAQGLCLPGSPSVVVVERLDRHASSENEAWSTLSRGDGLDLPGASWEGHPARIGPEQRVLPFRP